MDVAKRGYAMTLTDNAYAEIIKAYQTTVDQLTAVIKSQSKVITTLTEFKGDI